MKWLILISLFVALALCTIQKEVSEQTEAFDGAVALRSSETAIVVAEKPKYNKRFLQLVLITLALNPQWLPSGVQLLVGAYTLAKGIYEINKNCNPPDDKLDCLFAVTDLLMASFVGVYSKYNQDTMPALLLGDTEAHAVYKHPVFAEVYMITHIPTINGSLHRASLMSGNNGTWAHHATVFSHKVAVYHLMYRLAHADDLGFANDGNYHHYRMQPVVISNSSNSTVGKREIQNTDGIYEDYIWNNNSPEIWGTFHDVGHDVSNVVGSETANWMEENQAQASCMVPCEQISTHGGSSTTGGDNGVIAWNTGSGYDFNGQAGEWLDECSYNN